VEAQRCLNPEVGVDRRELGADDVAADHRNPLGENVGVAVRRLIRRHDSLAVDLGPRQRPLLGTRTDNYGFSAQRLAVYRNGTFGVSVPNPLTTVTFRRLSSPTSPGAGWTRSRSSGC
jgi:hypothetical protein